jgi:hypothetical protein
MSVLTGHPVHTLVSIHPCHITSHGQPLVNPPSRKLKAQRASQFTPKGKGIRPEDIEIGCSAHKLKTTFTDTHVQFGHKSISKAALARISRICNCGPSGRCWAVALSAMRWPICLQLCPCPQKEGHESHNSSQHRFTPTERALCGKLAAP